MFHYNAAGILAINLFYLGFALGITLCCNDHCGDYHGYHNANHDWHDDNHDNDPYDGHDDYNDHDKDGHDATSMMTSSGCAPVFGVLLGELFPMQTKVSCKTIQQFKTNIPDICC